MFDNVADLRRIGRGIELTSARSVVDKGSRRLVERISEACEACLKGDYAEYKCYVPYPRNISVVGYLARCGVTRVVRSPGTDTVRCFALVSSSSETSDYIGYRRYVPFYARVLGVPRRLRGMCRCFNDRFSRFWKRWCTRGVCEEQVLKGYFPSGRCYCGG